MSDAIAAAGGLEENERDYGRSTPRSAPAHDAQLEKVWQRGKGVAGWLTTTNHKDIGLMFILTACGFFLAAGVLALMMRTQLAVPKNGLMGPDLYNMVFTTHGTTMMFLFAVPVMEGMGLYFVPLMIGARNVALPRLMAFAYWIYLIAGLLLYIGLFCNAGPDMGWFSYTPLAGPEYSPGKRVDIWSCMVTLVEIGSLASAVDIVTTIFKLRAPGMALHRVPLFVWAQLVTNFMVIFAMPAVSLCSTMLSMDRLTNVSTQFYNHAEGGDHLLWQHLFWFFGHPDVYIIFIPATGFISSIIPTFARRPVFGYTPLVLSMIATAFIGFGVWVHHMFATPLPELGQGLFTAASLMIVIPNGIQIFCWTMTLWLAPRRPRLATPLLFTLGFFAIFICGGLTGVILASVQINTQVHDTHFVVAHLHYVLIGGGVFPLLGAFCYWFPKFTGRMLSEKLGKISFWLLFVGFNLTFFPLHYLGLIGQTRRVYTYLPETGWGPWNFVATIGAYIMGLGVATFIANVLISRKRGIPAGPNPWDGATFEWATSSPPPPYNFANPPVCEGSNPVWEQPMGGRYVVGLSQKYRQVLSTTILDAVPEHRFTIAGDGIVPLLLALAVATVFIGSVFHPLGFAVGLALMLVVLYIWFWQAGVSKPPGV